jgi:peptidyl-prolyl cis-trans isomerase A (cyclophilin A)
VLNRIYSRLRSSSPQTKSLASCVENLESRVLFHAPHVTNIIADNRGEVIFQMDHAMKASTVNGTSVQMHTAGKDAKFGTLDDVKINGTVRYFTGNKRITFRPIGSGLAAGTVYSMKLNSKRLLADDGTKLDGEYKGTKTTGNGTAGGDTLIIAKRNTASTTARFTLAVGGAFNVQLFTDKTPLNAANFVAYANASRYDSTFIHRSLPGFIVQGGGFNVTSKNALGQVTENATVANEPGVSNTRGTIALARPDDNNPATDDKGSSQFFFNLADTNASNLDKQNGGFTAFGKVTDANGLAVMDSIAAFPTINGGGVFANLPVVNKTPAVTGTDVGANPAGTLILFRRVAILSKIVAFA